jgi:hypothetical protein
MEVKSSDYYEFLQISRHADDETIHRVYRFLAARYHPDNVTTGNAEKFEQLKTAHDVLSDPDRRSEYDAGFITDASDKPPLSSAVDFLDTLNGELNRRLAVLAVLYFRRRSTPHTPEVSLAEIEARMGFPRDYLDFTVWYLMKKGYITRADNSDFTLTAPGVDFVETQRVNIPLLNKMLTNGEAPAASSEGEDQPDSGFRPLIVLPDMTVIADRRATGRDRRANAASRLAAETDGHSGLPSRRAAD